MVEPIDYKRLYELSIIEKEQIINERSKYLEQVNNLTKELNEYKIENFSKKNYYQKNKEKIIEKVKEYNKNYYVKHAEEIKIHNKQYKENNIDKLRDISKKYRESNPEKIREQKKRYLNKKKEQLEEKKDIQ